MSTEKRKVSMWWLVVLGVLVIVTMVVVTKNSGLKTKNTSISSELSEMTKNRDSLANAIALDIEAKEKKRKKKKIKKEAKEKLLKESGLADLNLSPIYWRWNDDSSSIKSGIASFELWTDNENGYPIYRQKVNNLVYKTFDGDFSTRRDYLINFFLEHPYVFKKLYNLNSSIVKKLKKDWGLVDQGEELMMYLRSTKYPYEATFEVYYQYHTKNNTSVFGGDDWVIFHEKCIETYPNYFKEAQDVMTAYGHWRIVRANFSKDAKSVLLYILTDYNNSDQEEKENKKKKKPSISDLLG